MCSPEKKNWKHCSPCTYLTIGGTLLAIISMVTYMYLKVEVSGGGDKIENVLTNHLSRQGSDIFPGSLPPKSKKKTCKKDTCGTDAKCHEGNCACPPKYAGDPTVKCEKLECVGDENCEDKQACSSDYKCVNPCQPENTCGLNATCDVFIHTAVCSCPTGFDGNPFIECKVADQKKFVSGVIIPDAEIRKNPCFPSPCGPNSVCRILVHTAVCSCKPEYKLSPPNCKLECESDNDCGSQYACRKYRCVTPCVDCGENAHCNTSEVSEHRAVCKCPTGYTGDPLDKCVPECEASSDCPNERHACIEHSCVDPCIDACGVNANCSVIHREPICSCPANRTGNPLEYCWTQDVGRTVWSRGIEAIVCDPNPCGTNATCSLAVYLDDSNLYYCACPPEFFGNPYKSCQLAECKQDSDCIYDKACTESQCVDPCEDNPCGYNAVCRSRSHVAICTCIEGTIGDPFKKCLYSVSGQVNKP